MPNFGAEPIYPALARKLDAFTVPALPGGFADRALAAALSLPEGEAQGAAAPLPRQRRSIPRRWWRGGAAGLGVVAAGMLSISAAAMGYFGEPVRLAIHRAPVIGKVIERVIPERPRRKAKLVPVSKEVAKPAPAPVASAMPAEQAQTAGPFGPPRRTRAEIRRVLADPEARKAWIEAHPEAARRIAARRAVRVEVRRRRVEAGIAPPAGPEAGPAIEVPARRAWRLERLERLRQWRERRQRLLEERTLRNELPEPPVAPAP